MKAVTATSKIRKWKPTKTRLTRFYFLETCLFRENFSWTSTIRPGIFRGWALWADSFSLWTNTIATCDQFRPIKIRKNLLVNYNLRVVQYCQVDSIRKGILRIIQLDKWRMLLTIRQVELAIGKLHLISGTYKRFHVILVAGPQCNFVDSINSFDSSNGEFYWRSDKWSCPSENCISLVGLKKYFTILLWQGPSETLSIRSILSIRRMENFIDDPTSGVVDQKIASY